MSKRNWQIITLIAIFVISSIVYFIHLTTPERHDDILLNRMHSARILTNREMKHIQGGWLTPKARKARGGCLPCQECQARSRGEGPSLNATTAEVYDYLSLLSVGARGIGLSLGLTYSSHLADGTNTIIDTTMGAGWTHSYNSFLLKRGADFIWIRGDTEIVTFTNRGGGYASSTGQFMTLTETGFTAAEVKLKDGTVYRFQQTTVPWEPAGVAYMLDEIVDTNSRITAFSYNPDGLLTRVTGPFGSEIDFEYTLEDKLSRISASGREALFEYNNPTEQLSVVVLPDGERFEYEYNFRGQLTAENVPGGRIHRVDYNTYGKAHRLWAPGGEMIASQTSTTGWATDHQKSLETGEIHYVPGTATVIDGRGNQWEHTYNERGNIIQTLDPKGNLTLIKYDGATLMRSRIIDGNGNANEYEYDAQGNQILIRDAEGNETSFVYDLNFSLPTKKIEPDGDEWIYEYDSNGNLTKEIDPIIELPDDAVITYTYDANGLRKSATDRNGNVTQWEYHPDGNIEKVIDPAGAETTCSYDAFGNTLTQTVHNDSGDQITTYTYDACDRVITDTDPLGHTTKYEYDANGNRTAVYVCWIDDTHYRSVTEYEYDARGRLIKTVEDKGRLDRITEYEYDVNGNQTKQTNPNGVVTDYEYDSLNRLIHTVLDPNGLAIEWQYEYDAVGNKTDETNPNGYLTTYEYDSLNRLRFTTDALDKVTEFRYSTPGGGSGCACGTPGSDLISCIIDAEGKVTQYEYDPFDRRIREVRQVGIQDCNAIEDIDDVVTQYQYDPSGNLLTEINPNGNTTTYTYTPRDEVESVSNGCGETTSYVYDLAGNRIEEHLPNGNIVHYEYDLNNLPVYIYDMLGDIVEYTNDCIGNRLTETDPNGPPTQYAYDNLNRLITIIDPMSQQTQYEYDEMGNQTKVTDREGNETVYEYDNANRRTVSKIWPEQGGDAAFTVYEYDSVGNLISITDAMGNTTAYEYDPLNRLITETYADETERRFTYDGVNNLLTREDNMGDANELGNITTYNYDDLNRLVRRQYADGSADVFTYDKGGRMLSADNNHSHIGYTYDCADRVLANIQTDLPQTYSYTVSYAYDVAAKTRTITYSGGKVVVETRDLRNQLIDISGAASYSYDLSNRVITKTFANGTEARYSYNDNDWITELRHVASDGITTLAGFAHDYDREGNRLNAVNLQEVISIDPNKPVTQSEEYTYDDIYRLVDYKRGLWIGNNIPSPTRIRTWQLDNVHNWTQFSIDGKVYTNSVNQMNEYDDFSTDGAPPVPDDDGLPDDFMVDLDLLVFDLVGDAKINLNDAAVFVSYWLNDSCSDPDWCGGADFDKNGSVDSEDLDAILSLWLIQAGRNFAHDKNGNQVSDGAKEYYYDYQTAMGSSIRAENHLTMVKDKTTSTMLGQYWYDALGRRIRKLASGISTVYVYTTHWQAIEEYEDSALTRSYVYGNWIDEVLAINHGGQINYYHENSLYSVIAVSDWSGNYVERYAYDAYGCVTVTDGAGVSVPHNIWGKPHSAIGNPYMFTGRRYDEGSGLYFYRSRYYYSEKGRFLQRDTFEYMYEMNSYEYVKGNPLNWLDPLGFQPKGKGIKKEEVKVKALITDCVEELGKNLKACKALEKAAKKNRKKGIKCEFNIAFCEETARKMWRQCLKDIGKVLKKQRKRDYNDWARIDVDDNQQDNLLNNQISNTLTGDLAECLGNIGIIITAGQPAPGVSGGTIKSTAQTVIQGEETIKGLLESGN